LEAWINVMLVILLLTKGEMKTELEVKETTDTAPSASFLDLYLEFDDSGQLGTKIYDKRDFNFKIINFCKNVQQYTSFSCIWCLHLAIDSLCKGQ
jgi:hypothetical protein